MTAAIKPTTRYALIAAVTMGLLGASVSSALAASGGTGAFNARANINVPPPPFGDPCATYSNHNAQLAFPDDKSTFTASSDPNPTSDLFQWGEFADGTHHPQTSAAGTTSATGSTTTSCSDAPGQEEQGFTGTLTRTSDVCNLTGGSYKRIELTVTYSFPTTGMSGASCPTSALTVTATIPSVKLPVPIAFPPDGSGIVIDYLSACNSPIAPTSCVLEKGSY